MALGKAKVDIPFGGGIAEDVDERLLNAPLLSQALNVRFDKKGALRKRQGFEAANGTNLPSDTDGVNAVFDHGGAPALYSKRGVWTFSDAESGWVAADSRSTPPLEFDVYSRVASYATVTEYDAANDGTYLVEVWRTDGKMLYRVVDYATGAIVSQPKAVNATASAGSHPYVVNIGGTFFLFILTAANAVAVSQLNAVTWAWSSFSTAVAATVDYFDVHVQPGETVGWIVAVMSTTAVDVYPYDESTGIGTAKTLSWGADGPCRVYHDADNDLVLVGACDVSSGTQTVLKLATLDETPNEVFANSAALTLPGYRGDDFGGANRIYRPNVAVCTTKDGSVFAAASSWDRAVFTGVDNDTTYPATKWAIFDTASGLPLASDEYFTGAAFLSGRCFRPSNEEPCFLLEHSPAIPDDRSDSWGTEPKSNATIVVMLDTESESVDAQTGVETGTIAAFPTLIGRVNRDVAATKKNPDGWLSHIEEAGGDNRWVYPLPVIDTVRATRSEPNEATFGRRDYLVDFETLAAGRLCRLDFSPGPSRILRAGDGAVVNQGGHPMYFDGQLLGENALLFTPTVASISRSDTGSGDAQERSFRCVLVVKDQLGNLHRTAPTPPIVLNSIGVVSNVVFNLHLPDLTMWRERTGYGLFLQVYATDDTNTDDGPYGLIDEVELVKSNDIFTATLNTDLYRFDTVDAAPALYTEGRILQNEPPPPFLDVAYGTERAFGISAENPSELWQSKLPQFGIALEFNPDLVTSVNPDVDLVAVAAMDEKVILFSDERVFVARASQKDNRGIGRDSPPQEIPAGTGCVNKRSVVEGPFGVMFQGARGFYIVDRGLSVKYVGGPVEVSLQGKTIYSATVEPYHQEVRFTTFGGDEMYVFDYERGAWRIQPMDCFHADMVGTRFYTTKNTSLGYAVTRERLITDSSYADDGDLSDSSAIENEMQITTSWLKLTGLQGYKRIRKILTLGEYRAQNGSSVSGRIQIKLAYDYDDTWVETHEHDLAGMTAGDPLQLETRPAKRTCQAIKIGIVEVPSKANEIPFFDTYEEGVVISGLTLELGVKKGVFRRPQNRA